MENMMMKKMRKKTMGYKKRVQSQSVECKRTQGLQNKYYQEDNDEEKDVDVEAEKDEKND